jgi:hypothetical protein
MVYLKTQKNKKTWFEPKRNQMAYLNNQKIQKIGSEQKKTIGFYDPAFKTDLSLI